MADRFVPASQVQGGSLPTDDSGLPVGALLGAGKSGTGLLASGSRFLDMPALTGGLQGASGVLGVGSGINKLTEGNYAGGTGDLLTGATGTLSGADKLGLISMSPTLAGGLGVVGGAAGIGLGANQLAQGDMSGIAGIYGGTLGATAGLGTIAGTGALGGTMAAAAPAMVGALNPVTLGLGAFIAIGLMNLEAQKAARIKNQTLESGEIRRGGTQALETLDKTGRFLPGLDKLPPEQLSQVLEQYHTGLTQWPKGQQMLATQGQGGKVSLTEPLSPEQLTAYSEQFYPRLRDTEAGYLWALDAAARQGQPMPEWLQSFGHADPAALLNNLSHGYSGTQQMLQPGQVDYSQAVPGNLVNFFQQQTAGDPKLAQLFAGLPALPGTAPTAEAMQQQSSARQQQAQTLAQQMGGDINSQGKNIETLAYTAPYTPGGLQQSLTETFGANAEEQAMIADQLARGGDPVGIRSVIQASREQQAASGGGG